MENEAYGEFRKEKKFFRKLAKLIELRAVVLAYSESLTA